MNDEAHVGVFYSAGRDLDAMLRQVEARFAGGRITLLLPPALARARRHGGAVHEIIAVAPARSLGGLVRVTHLLRRRRFSDFITFYPSRRLRILAALSGAPRCAALDEDGTLVPLSASLAAALVRAAWNEVRGGAAWLWVWAVVRFRRVHADAAPPRG